MSVVDEAVRTIRVAALDPLKNTQMKEIFDKSLKEAVLLRMDSMSEFEVDALWTLVPEAQFERIAAGTPCMDNNGKRFTVANLVHDASEIHPMAAYFTPIKVNAVSYSAERPEQQDLVTEPIYSARTLIDLDKEQAVNAARGSILKDSEVVKKLLSLFKPDTQLPSKNKRAHLLLKTFALRGVFAMMAALESEYTTFLQEHGLVKDLSDFISQENMRSVDDLEHLFGSSATHLELRLDVLRSKVINSDLKQNERSEQVCFTNSTEAKLILMTKATPQDEE